MKLSIRRKLLIGFTLLLVLAFIIQGFSFGIVEQYISSEITALQEVEAKDAGTDILNFFTKLNSESLGLAQSYNKDRGNFVTVSQYTLKNNNFIQEITILSLLGHELVQVNPSGQVEADKLSYEVYSEPFKSAVAGIPAISQVYYLGSNSEPYIDTFYPILGDRHTIVGVVKMQVNLNQLRSELAHVRLGNNGYVYVVDNDGVLISHPSQAYVLERPLLSSRKVIANALSNTPSSFKDEQYTNEKNVAVVAKAVRISDYNWVAIFEQPTSEAFSFLTFIKNLFVVTVGISFLFLLLIALFLSENLTRPIRKLQEYVEKGQVGKIISIKSGDEIESLSHSFASLVDQLLLREHMVVKVSSELKAANEKLKVLDKLKTEFVSVASHELRTPMTAIKSYLWMALKGKGGELNERQRFYIERSYNSVDRLGRLVNDMLNISRIESGHITIDFQAVDLHKVAQEVIDEVLPRAGELGVFVSMQKMNSSPIVLADPDKIKEVLFNLIGNSLKFTERGGKIIVSFVQKDSMIETIVRDTGMGIATEDIGKLFQKFGILPGTYITNQTAMGTGLGLYICRSIIDLHHGEIKVKSEGKGKGATFIFSLKKFKDADLEYIKNQQADEKKDKVGLIHAKL
ncbi:MAG TPA: sensor histidine kinase [Candidatus Saccharimonadales bacterium]|nr:sensor histidine kinase [Candidatus Saccharimonadales bacterium]